MQRFLQRIAVSIVHFIYTAVTNPAVTGFEVETPSYISIYNSIPYTLR